MAFLPTTRQEMEERGWSCVDFVYVCGDAYVDHPSFGAAIITRLLEAKGFRVGVIAQPDWRVDSSIAVFGEPRLGFLVSAGNMDSMVNHFTVAKKRRGSDAYSPGGAKGLRPDHAAVVYSNLIRHTFRRTPIILGGIEASLRRLAHYDYWSDSIKRSILLDSGADLVSYGMGEHSIVAIAEALDAGLDIRDITFIEGTVYRTDSLEGIIDARQLVECAGESAVSVDGRATRADGCASAGRTSEDRTPEGRTSEDSFDAVLLPSFEELQDDRLAYARSFAVQYRECDPVRGRRLIEPYARGGQKASSRNAGRGADRARKGALDGTDGGHSPSNGEEAGTQGGTAYTYVVQNPPAAPLTMAEMDAVYRLPFERAWHPSYDAAGGVPALSEVQFSLTSSRGCFGECAFCALTFHQGRIVTARSHDALEAEARLLTQLPGFKGYIHDVGGPTADFRAPACAHQHERGACANRRCLSPQPCKQLEVDHADYLQLLRRLRALPGVKKVFVRSGIRFDYVLQEPDGGASFMRELCEHHVSGQLKVAPEHVSAPVLDCMGKPPRAVFERFAALYERTNRALGKKQYLVPYLMSSHPGCGMREAVELAEFCRDLHYNPEQVQDFYPTPSTLSTVMYATGVDPRTMQSVHVVRNPHEKALQRALIQYRNPQNRELVREALRRAGREDLIGYGPHCLVRPQPGPKGAGKASPKGTGKANAKGNAKSAAQGSRKDGQTDGPKGKGDERVSPHGAGKANAKGAAHGAAKGKKKRR